eukprot:g21258.t1
MVTKVLPISDHYEPGGNFFLDEERSGTDGCDKESLKGEIDARDRRESLDGLLSTQSIDSDNAGANLPRLESFEGSSLLEPGGAVVPAGAAGGADPDRGGTAAFVARGVDGRGARKPKASLLLLVVIALWIVDLVFAMDSVASKLATVNDLYLNVASAAFAMMGLRSLYFLMESLVQSFHMLKYGIAAILVLIGLKMVFSVWFEISNSRPAQQDTDDLLGAWQGSVVLFLPKHRVLKRKCKHHNRRPAQSADHPYDWSTGLHFTTSGVTFVLIIAICIASAVSSYWNCKFPQNLLPKSHKQKHIPQAYLARQACWPHVFVLGAVARALQRRASGRVGAHDTIQAGGDAGQIRRPLRAARRRCPGIARCACPKLRMVGHQAPQQMEEWSVTPKEDDLEAGAQMNVDWSKTPEVWDPTALSQYVASIQGLVQSCFQEGAAGVRLIGIKPWAVDFELWDALGDVVLSEVVFESLGEELKAATAEGGFAILVYMGQEDFASALRLAARNASQNVSACAVKIVESGVMGI